MCGRAKLETDVSEIKIAFRIPPDYPTPNLPPSWNVVPVDNFYEWQKIGPKGKQPYAIALADRSLMALAGLWEMWKSRANNETIRSFTIVTTTPNEVCA